MEELDILIEDMGCKMQQLTNEVDALNDFGNTPNVNYLAMLDKLQEWKKLRFVHGELIHLRSAINNNQLLQPNLQTNKQRNK
jgi:hypothetical protein